MTADSGRRSHTTSLLRSVLIFLLLFSPVISWGGFVAPVGLWILVGSAIAGALVILARPAMDRPVALPFCWMFLMTVVAFTVAFLGVTVDILLLQHISFGWLTLLAGFSIFTKLYAGRGGESALANTVFWVGVCHSMIVLTVVHIPESRIIYEYLLVEEYAVHTLDRAQRSPGLTSNTGASLSLVHSFCALMGVWLLISSPPRFSRTMLIWLGLLLSLGAMAYTGRLGMYLFFVGLLFMTVRFVVLEGSIPYRLAGLAGVIAVSGVFALLAAMNFQVAALQRTFEPLLNWILGVGFSTASTDVILRGMLFLPDSDWRALFGYGHLGRGDIYVASDVGFVRLVYAYGVLGVALWIGFFASLWLRAHNFVGRGGAKSIVGVLTCYCLLLFLANLKELFYITSRGYFLIFVLTYFAVVHANRVSISRRAV